ncbi:MAG: hypothetical protein E3K32_08510 [wastewater metagenome]|nr:hypothetical protein [Candidatus Loosdrechtia aerotolerans]
MTKTDEPLYVTLSLDIDPDANSPVKGQYDALSSPVQYGTVRVEACKRGLEKIFELFDIYDIQTTVFYEARTAQMLISDGMDLPKLSEGHEIACHSLRHEDFLGKVSGAAMEENTVEETIKKATEILENIFGCRIKGFRAPYTRINRTIIKVLERLGFQYDSSETVTLGTAWAGRPFPLRTYGSNLPELALPSFHDKKGKRMSSYLWGIFEGRRTASEYVDAAVWAKDRAEGGLFLFAIHPWHLYVDHQGNAFSEEQATKNLKDLEYILLQIKHMEGIQMIRQDAYLEHWLQVR